MKYITCYFSDSFAFLLGGYIKDIDSHYGSAFSSFVYAVLEMLLLPLWLLFIILQLEQTDRQLSSVLTFSFLYSPLCVFLDPYSPQVLIKTRLDRAILSKDYSLQCNSRGNPLPQLLWSKKTDINETLEYYPLSKQCHRSCRIYSIQYK